MRVSLPYDKPIVANVKVRSSGLGAGLLNLVLCAYPLVLALLTMASIVAPARTGLRAVAQIFAPHLFLPLLLIIPFAFRRGVFGVGVLRLLLITCTVLFCVRYLPAFAAPQPVSDPSAPKLSVMTWNVFTGNRREDYIRDFLLAEPADVVVLQEVSRSWLAGDDVGAAYPYRVVGPQETAPGMALLSKYPVLDSGVLSDDSRVWDIPRLMWATLDIGGTHITVMSAHPISPYYKHSSSRECSLPVCFDSSLRDRQIVAMRETAIDPLIAGGTPFILAGDFNVTEREPAYGELSSGLTDTFKALGAGLGTTWRPPFIMSQPLGLLRIDYLFAGPGVTPLSVDTDCTPRSSDHCVLIANFQIGE
jgi:endonuclease/exonuclease/phosphatase (EEP) superfamily protein YafD